MKIFGKDTKQWVARLLPGQRSEHPVSGFLRGIADAFVDEPSKRDDFVLDAMKGMLAQLESRAEAEQIRELRAKVADGGEITPDEQTQMQALQERAKTTLDRLLQTASESKAISPAEFSSTIGAWQQLEVAYEILGWEAPLSDKWLTPIANAALETAANQAIETKERHGGPHQGAISSVLRSEGSYGYTLDDNTLRLAAKARKLYLNDEPEPEPIADARIAWRQPNADRSSALESLKILTPSALKSALTTSDLQPPLTVEEKHSVVSSCCSRAGWRASELRTVLNDGNPYAAPSGHRILTNLHDAIALAAAFDVELTDHEFEGVPEYEGQLVILTARLSDPKAEGCPVVSRADIIAALSKVTPRDFEGALKSLTIEPAMSPDETRRIVEDVVHRELERAIGWLEAKNDRVKDRIGGVRVLVDEGRADRVMTNRKPNQNAAMTLRVLGRVHAFAARYDVKPEQAAVERQAAAEAASVDLLAELETLYETCRAAAEAS